ncbi:KilA-N domain-containing protein [Providencia rettgeri]|uniref:KilA-N domain-containing protein n=1 Tax=Providencia rettgeri TaxID=587 RepID=UPI001F042762|nr:KilA-N domain-containing protein [Providencia rettgeri]MCG9943677.1 KilA-N domain-containing protein [Providencia rettgeri]
MTNIIPLEYDGHPIRFNDDGWINATDVAAKFDKEPTAWLRQIDVLEYLSALSRKLFSNSGFVTELSEIKRLDSTSSASRTKVLRFVKRTGLVKTKAGYQGGTWLHPKLAVRFARWLSVDFEIWCDEQIDALIRGNMPVYNDERINAIFLLEKPTSWEKRFQQPFYQALSRMSGLPYSGHVGGCPSLFGMITAKWVYQAVLPDSVYEEAKQMAKDSKDKIHQYLKPEALQLVQDQLVAVTTLANGCIDYKDFEARCVQAFGKSGMQGLLVFPSNRQSSHAVTLQ